MNYLLIALCLLTATSALAADGKKLATPMERTIFSSLEGGKSKTYDLTIPKGKTSISVEQTDAATAPVLAPVFTCTFSANGEIGLLQKKVSQCLGNLELKSETKLSLKVLNESKNSLDFVVKQSPIK